MRAHTAIDATPGKSRRDPTGTAALRSPLRHESDRRMSRVKRSMQALLVEHDILGLGDTGVINPMMVLSPDRGLKVFYEWMLRELFMDLVDDAVWPRTWIRAAYAKGLAKARRELHRDPAPNIVAMRSDRAALYGSIAAGDLKGIAHDLAKRANRLAGDAIVKRQTPAALVRAISTTFNNVGRTRLYAMSNTLIVRAYNDAKLDWYREDKVRQVGLVVETLPRRIVRDAPFDELGVGSVEIMTAEDDAVCEDCQNLADEGPYLVDDVFGILPLHPNCRCEWVPLGDPRLDEEG